VQVEGRSGKTRIHRFASGEPLVPGSVVRLDGREWLVERVDDGVERTRVVARPARYRLRLRHPDGHEELGAFRRYRLDSPKVGHGLTTIEDGEPSAWTVATAALARDDDGEPYLDLVAERDYGEFDALPNHQLEHALDTPQEELPEGLRAMLSRAADAGVLVELVALEPGELPDWDESRRYLDALILEEVDDDLLVRCGVDVEHEPRDAWIATVKERLRADLASFAADVDGDHAEIEEWEFADGRIFAAVGTWDDEGDPVSSFGRLCRLVDSGALAAAGFRRVRKAELQPLE
jgi:hypothetical protein